MMCQIIRQWSTSQPKQSKALVIILLWVNTAWAGVDFSMMADPQFILKSQAISFGATANKSDIKDIRKYLKRVEKKIKKLDPNDDIHEIGKLSLIAIRYKLAIQAYEVPQEWPDYPENNMQARVIGIRSRGGEEKIKEITRRATEPNSLWFVALLNAKMKDALGAGFVTRCEVVK